MEEVINSDMEPLTDDENAMGALKGKGSIKRQGVKERGVYRATGKR